MSYLGHSIPVIFLMLKLGGQMYVFVITVLLLTFTTIPTPTNVKPASILYLLVTPAMFSVMEPYSVRHAKPEPD